MSETPSTAPAWARTVIDPFGNDLRGPAELLADFLARYDSRETRDRYRVDIGQFLVWMERFHSQVPVLVAQAPHIDAYRQYLRSNHWADHPGTCWNQCKELPYDNRSTRDGKISAVSAYFKYVVGQKRCDSNPVLPDPGRRHSHDQKQERLKAILMPAEIVEAGQIAKAAANGLSGIKMPTLRTAAIFSMLVGPGLRVAELHTGRIERFGWRGDTRTLRILRKGGKWETIDIPDQTWAVVKAYLGNRTSGPIIISEGRRARNKETGELEFTALSPNKIGDAVTELSKACGMGNRLHPHLLRHTSITLALTHPQATPQRVMAYYGHDSMETTMRYYNHKSLLAPGHLTNFYGIDWSRQGMVLSA